MKETYTRLGYEEECTSDCTSCCGCIDDEVQKTEPFPIAPLYDFVILKKDEETKTSSGLFVPESIKGRATTGTVVAVGPGLYWEGRRIPTTLKVGDRVYVKEFSGYIVEHDGQKFHVYKESEILGRLIGEIK